jgi:hypothetical protein
MDVNAVQPGIRVRITTLETTKGMMIAPKHLSVRQAGLTGVVKTWVPGHGGDVWFVQHDGSEEVGAYCFTEMEQL